MQASPSPSILAWIATSPGRALACILAVHMAVWTVLPATLYPNLPLDLIEALTYGREWQLGYDKLPPLPWWLVEIVYRAIGHDFGFYLLAQVAVVAALALVYVTSRPLAGPVGALVAVLIVDGLHYLSYTAAKFNHDVIQLPFWALAGYALHRALRGGWIGHWALLGAAIGISLWAKYFVVMLAVPIALFVLVDADARKCLKTPGPYVAAAVALIIMAPHLMWLVQNDFLPLGYAERRAVLSRGWYDHVWHPAQFLIGQIFFLIPSLLIALPLFISRFLPRRAASETPVVSLADAYDMRIVTWLAFGPIAAVLALAAVSGRGTVAMWGYPLWMFIGLWLVLSARRTFDPGRLGRILITWGIVSACMAGAFVANYAVLPHYDHRYRAVFYPGERLALELNRRYRAVTGQPIAYVIGDMWTGGNIAHYAPSHPRVLIDGDRARAPWIDIADLNARGAVVVWTQGDLDTIPIGFRNIAGEAAVQPPFLIPDRRGESFVNVGWAVLLPKPAFAGLKQ